MRDLIITSRGRELATRLAGGLDSARFTKLCASSEDYSGYDIEGIKALTALCDVKQTVKVSGVRLTDGSAVEITAAMDNSSLDEGYYTRAVGLYAEASNNEEILFAVSIEPDAPYYMPPMGGKAVSGVTYKLRVKVGDSDNVIIKAPSDVFATAVQLEDEAARLDKRIDSISALESIEEHNLSSAAHPSIRAALESLNDRVRAVEIASSADVASNPFAVTFGTLNGVAVNGIWNDQQARLEF